MERMGQINVYVCLDCQHAEGVVLLNSGVTGFSKICTACGNPSSHSSFYRVPALEVSIVAFRPRDLEKYEGYKGHILNGGLVFAELGQEIDPLYPDFSGGSGHEEVWKGWEQYVKENYGELELLKLKGKNGDNNTSLPT